MDGEEGGLLLFDVLGVVEYIMVWCKKEKAGRDQSYLSLSLVESARRLLYGSSSLRTLRGTPICCRCTVAGLSLDEVERERAKRKKRSSWRLRVSVRPSRQFIAFRSLVNVPTT